MGTIAECFPLEEKQITWIDVDGVHQPEIVEEIGTLLDIHPLVLEDILNTAQRPKMEDFGKYIFVVLKMLSLEENEIASEQISFILGQNFVISFQEREGDIFDPIRERIRHAKGKVRKMGSDYLVYALADAVVDDYFAVLEKIGEQIEDMEDEVVTNPTSETMQTIHNLKRNIILLRKSTWPLREVISELERGETVLIDEKTGIYFRDVYDHTIQVIDIIETLRDVVSGMLDIYLTSISNRMNEIMKVLTIIATIFIPLTFIAGIYGMNFVYMPELGWHWGYFAVLLSMIFVGACMVVYFRKKKWL